MDESYLERGIIGLFFIDLLQLSQTKAALLRNFRMQPSEVDSMAYWEYEYLLEALNQQVQEENKRQQEEMDKYKIQEKLAAASRRPKAPPPVPAPKMPSVPSLGGIRL